MGFRPGPDILHLQYDNANKLLDYGLYDADGKATLDDVTLETDVGWSKLLIQQCYQHDSGTGSSLKTDLGEQDITDLFSGTVTVRVANDRAEGLTIAKTVTGNTAPAGESYQIEIYVEDDGSPFPAATTPSAGRGEERLPYVYRGKSHRLLAGGGEADHLRLAQWRKLYGDRDANPGPGVYHHGFGEHGEARPGHEATGILTDGWADGAVYQCLSHETRRPRPGA